MFQASQAFPCYLTLWYDFVPLLFRPISTLVPRLVRTSPPGFVPARQPLASTPDSPQPARCRYSLRQPPCQRRNRPPALHHRVQEPARPFASPLLNVKAKKGGAIWPRLFCTHSNNWLTGLSAYPWPKPVRASSFAAFQRRALRSDEYARG